MELIDLVLAVITRPGSPLTNQDVTTGTSRLAYGNLPESVVVPPALAGEMYGQTMKCKASTGHQWVPRKSERGSYVVYDFPARQFTLDGVFKGDADQTSMPTFSDMGARSDNPANYMLVGEFHNHPYTDRNAQTFGATVPDLRVDFLRFVRGPLNILSFVQSSEDLYLTVRCHETKTSGVVEEAFHETMARQLSAAQEQSPQASYPDLFTHAVKRTIQMSSHVCRVGFYHGKNTSSGGAVTMARSTTSSL